MSPDQVARVEALCRRYLSAMASAGLEAVLGNFTGDATVISPISGKQTARDFYTYVMRVTGDHAIKLREIFVSVSDPSHAAVHFEYTRTVGNGKPATIDVVDDFKMTEDLRKFAAATIIYDTAPVPSDFDALDVGEGQRFNRQCHRHHNGSQSHRHPLCDIGGHRA